MTVYHKKTVDIFDSRMLPGKVQKLEDQDLHLWSVNRNLYNEQKTYSEYFLNEDEQNRAQRFRFRKDHDLFVIGRYITKMLLAYYTESTPGNVKIVPGSYGKPACEGNLFFNISHSGDQLLAGFSYSEIGVDIERIDPAVDVKRIGKSHFSGIEIQNMMSCTGDKRTDAFFETWTKKEALIKGIGKGLGIPLQDFNVTNCNGKVLWELPTGESYGNWHVQNIETIEEFKSAFATQHEPADIKYFNHCEK